MGDIERPCCVPKLGREPAWSMSRRLRALLARGDQGRCCPATKTKSLLRCWKEFALTIVKRSRAC
eukprot:1485280-Rhodomonas_salina.1